MKINYMVWLTRDGKWHTHNTYSAKAIEPIKSQIIERCLGELEPDERDNVFFVEAHSGSEALSMTKRVLRRLQSR